MIKRLVISIVFLTSIFAIANAQTKKNPFTLNLSEDGAKYIKFGINAQIWARYTELNPDSKVGSNFTSDTYDIVLRRLRMQALGMLTEKVFFHIQLGQNNINFTQNINPVNAPVSVLDLLGEYHFNEAFQIGGGLNGWAVGTNRYSAQSSSSQLTVDAPIYQQNNISATFGNRNISAYAKGVIGKVNYRLAIANPYKVYTNTISTVSSVSPLTPNPQFVGMLTYQFLEKESIAEPYNKATYLGTKKVFNIAAGYMYQNKAMWRTSGNTPADTLKEDMKVLGVDVFYDAPINEKGAALTLYAAYNNSDYGKNYLRNIATPNPASSGTGNGFLGIGTGNIFYGQAGYLFNKSKNEEKKARTQLYVASEVAALDALKTPMTMFEGGINYYLTGSYGPKVTLGYQNRAIFKTVAGESKQVENGRKGMVVLQYQVSF
jgi:hypothetical protein